MKAGWEKRKQDFSTIRSVIEGAAMFLVTWILILTSMCCPSGPLTTWRKFKIFPLDALCSDMLWRWTLTISLRLSPGTRHSYKSATKICASCEALNNYCRLLPTHSMKHLCITLFQVACIIKAIRRKGDQIPLGLPHPIILSQEQGQWRELHLF